jgi:fermentation-respiration switch protein FrsA (DUF1100 family)
MTRVSILSAIACFLLIGCSSLLYYPSPHTFVDPSLLPVKPDQRRYLVNDVNSQSYDIVAWHFRSPKADPAKATLIHFHGNGQNLTSHFASLYWVLNEGFDLFIFDYPGYGLSTGEPSPRNTVLVGQKIIEYFRDDHPNMPLIIYGESLGGAVAIKSVLQLKDRKNIKAVVADSTFLSYQKTARRFLSRHWLTWLFQPLAWVLISDKWAPGESVSQISPTPLLVIHGTADSIVDYDLGEEVYNLASEPKKLIKIQDGMHIQSFAGPQKAEIKKQFLDFIR